MAGTEWQLYPVLTTEPAPTDTFLILDVIDTSASSAGTVKQVTQPVAGTVAAQMAQRMLAN